jgi:uncharacterized protein YycO
VRIGLGSGFAPALSVVFAALAAASGCATSVSDVREADAGAPSGKALVFQRTALDPRNGGQLVSTTALLPGDILLSAADGVTSAGIRLVTLSPVSHAALYVGDGSVVEAVGSGVRARPVDTVLSEESVVVAFRDPRVTPDQGRAIAGFALGSVGQKYDPLGVVLQAPFSLERRACELPLVPDLVRDFCIRGIATIQLGAFANDRFFCSQFVLEAYRQSGLPLTDADPRWLSPRDILHMREGDVPSVRILQTLVYVGHLKYPVPSPALDRSSTVQ